MKVKKNNVSQTPKNSNLKKINFDRIKIEKNNLKILENENKTTRNKRKSNKIIKQKIPSINFNNNYLHFEKIKLVKRELSECNSKRKLIVHRTPIFWNKNNFFSNFNTQENENKNKFFQTLNNFNLKTENNKNDNKRNKFFYYHYYHNKNNNLSSNNISELNINNNLKKNKNSKRKNKNNKSLQSGISQINLTNNILTERENNKKDFIHIIKKREFSEREKNIICPIKNNKINNKKINNSSSFKDYLTDSSTMTNMLNKSNKKNNNDFNNNNNKQKIFKMDFNNNNEKLNNNNNNNNVNKKNDFIKNKKKLNININNNNNEKKTFSSKINNTTIEVSKTKPKKKKLSLNISVNKKTSSKKNSISITNLPTNTNTTTKENSDDFFSYENDLKPPFLTQDEKNLYGDRTPSESYKKIKLLGKGGCGIVWLVKNIENQKEFACKQISKKNIINYKIAKSEIEMMIFIKNNIKNIQNFPIFYEFFEDNFDLWIVYEKCGKDLSTLSIKIKGEFINKERIYTIKKGKFLEHFVMKDFTQLKIFLKQMFIFIQNLNKFFIIHGDIKPENILIEHDENFNIKSIKIIDYGSSYFLNKNVNFSSNTPEYLAPELTEILEKNGNFLLNKENIKFIHSLKNFPSCIDVWSLGATILEIITCIPLWMSYKSKVLIKGKNLIKYGIFGVNGRDANKILNIQKDLGKKLNKIIDEESICNCNINDFELFKDLLIKMLEFDYKKRIKPEDALNHPFLQC